LGAVGTLLTSERARACNPGRWNPRGIPVIYTAQNSSLCALETLASARKLASDYVVVKIEIPEDVAIWTLAKEEFPADWKAEVPPESTRTIGGQWVTASRTAVLSRLLDCQPLRTELRTEPCTRDFGRFSFSDPEPFWFPDRLKRRV
jgi:RES domain-containing protein